MMKARRWTYSTLIITLLLSVAANVGHTKLAVSTVPVGLRMVGAVAWPLLVFLAVEVLVRNTWLRTNSHRLARLLILIPGVPALVTSYEHMHAVLLAMGERDFIAAIGPASVDTLMIGCTLTLLFMRAAPAAPAPIEISDEELEQTLERWSVSTTGGGKSEAVTETVEQALAQGDAVLAIETKERAPRATKADQREAVEQLLRGMSVADAATGTGVSNAVVGRFNTVLRRLIDNPMTDDFGSATGRVHPDLVALMRDHANRARAL